MVIAVIPFKRAVFHAACTGIARLSNFHRVDAARKAATVRRKSFMLQGFYNLVPGTADVFPHKLFGTGGFVAGDRVNNALVLCENGLPCALIFSARLSEYRKLRSDLNRSVRQS